MLINSWTRLTLMAAGLALSLMLATGISATDHARAGPAAMVIREQGSTASANLAGFGSSPGNWTADVMAACTKGTHFPDPKLS